MTDEELARTGMIGECDITMWALLIVATVSTDPSSSMSTTTIKYQRFFPWGFYFLEYFYELLRKIGSLHFGILQWDDGEGGWQLKYYGKR
jgi:hypothetical protein